MDSGLERAFLQRRHTDGQHAQEKMLSIADHWENATQNHGEISLHACQNGYCQKGKKSQVLVRV